MGGELLLGIDVGTTLLKAAVLDAKSGAVAASASVALAVRSESDGTREQDPGALDRALRRTMGSLRRQLGGSWGRITAAGLAAQGGSAILVDRRTGRAHTPIQLWNDTGPLALLGEIAAGKPAGYWRRLSYLAAPGAGLARIEWLRRRRPELFDGGNLYVGAGEYVYFKLTGVWRQDAGNALQIGCYDARRHRLAAGPLRLVGVDPSFVAPMREAHETHDLSANGAKLLGLDQGLPVAGPYMDHEAGYLSAVGTFRRPLQCSLGTAWVGNFVERSGPVASGALQLVLPSPIGPGSLLLRVMAAGNVSWDWALATFTGATGAKGFKRADDIFRKRLLPPEGLIALPWLTRPNLFNNEVPGAGGLLGVNSHTTKADMLRAVVAAMCFQFVRVLSPVIALGHADGMVLGGGASKGWFFRTILASLLAPLSVRYARGEDPGGLRGTVYAFSRTAARCTTSIQRPPDKTVRAEVRKRFDEYSRACDVLARGLGDEAPAFLRGDQKGRGR